MAKTEKVHSIITWFLGLPLRNRLSLAFFFLAFLGTFSLVWLAISSQNDLISHQEKEHLFGTYKAFCQNMDIHGRWAVSLASIFARNPEVASALAHRERLRLVELTYPAYLFMEKNYGISQFHFQVLPPRSFLRLHRLYAFGDDLSYRKTIQDAQTQGRETFGLERGLTGFGIRGVAPIHYEGKVVGTVEIGFAFGQIFLNQMRLQFGVEASVLLPDKTNEVFRSWATPFPEPFERRGPIYERVFRDGMPEMMIRDVSGFPFAVLVGPVRDYTGSTVALVELYANRSETVALTDYYRRLMLGIGIVGMLLSVGAIYFISYLFTLPIAKMVTFARRIALEKHGQHLEMRPSGELGVLADALNEMLTSLEESREQLQDYAENLERMVHLRTRALRESEEKYRTLVENVPLVVYRLLGSGRIIFINHFAEELLGVPCQDILNSPVFWKDKVWEKDRERIWPLMDRCLQEGREFKAEYRIRLGSGKPLFVLDHALPVLDEKGKVETVDGFLVDVTERYQLQQQIIQTEELRTLSEISARLAHEIRNPLAAAGGFARRLLHGLPAEDPQREKVQIIVSEVARLEKILERTLAYLKPFEIVMERTSLNELVRGVIDEHEAMLSERSIGLEVDLSGELEPMNLDPLLFERVLESLVRAVVAYCQSSGRLAVRTYLEENTVLIEITMKGVTISEDDVEHFFYPFTARIDPALMLDLPLVKMIVHKHKGLINLQLKDSNQLAVTISLPE